MIVWIDETSDSCRYIHDDDDDVDDEYDHDDYEHDDT